MKHFSLTAALFVSLSFLTSHAEEIDLSILDPFQESGLGEAIRNADSPDEKLTFNNTQEWAQIHLNSAAMDPTDLGDWAEKIVLAPPPRNTSERTAAELDYLMELKKLRNAENQAQIEAEVPSEGLTIGEYRLGDLPETHPELSRLFYFVYWEMNPILMQYKFLFDRVRPSYLRPEIEPTIEIPQHAAYPSGHSTVCHLYAYVLADILPEQKEEFIASAVSVAKNREIAGVHYPSDSSIGESLAQQIYVLLQDSEKYHEHLAKAKKEMEEKKAGDQ